MKINQKIEQKKMLTDKLENPKIEKSNITDIPSDVSNSKPKPLDSVLVKKMINKSDNSKPNIKNNIKDSTKNIKKLDDNHKENFIKDEVSENSLDGNISDNDQNINGNIDTLFDSDSSLSSVSSYESESDSISDDETIDHETIITQNGNINHINNVKEKKLNNSKEANENSYFDDTSSITSLSSLSCDEYISSSSVSPKKPKRKLRNDENNLNKEIKNTEKEETIDLTSDIVPIKRKRGRRKLDTSVPSSPNISNASSEQVVLKKKRGRKRKSEKLNYDYAQLQKINQDINKMWKYLCNSLNIKKQSDFRIPDSIVNEFEGLIRNPNNGNYLNSYEWNIVKMSNDGKITPFLTSDAFIPINVKCSKCQELIKEENKYYCEYCNSYYHCKCINNSKSMDIVFKGEIIQIDKPVDIFKQAYNLNLSSNYIAHNSNFKWCLQKKWICPNHKEKNPIPKPKLKYTIIPKEKKISSNISSPKLQQEDSSPSINLKKSVSHKKRKDDSKLNQSISCKSAAHTKKRSRNFSNSSSCSNNKPEITLKKKENIVLKFISNVESSAENNIILSKKKTTKSDPDNDSNIYINLKNEELLSTNIINKVIPKDSLKVLKPEIRYKASEEQIKVNFINKVYKNSKEMEDWLDSLILLHQDIIHQLHNKKLINTLPPSPSLNSPSTYLIDTLCSAIDYSKKEDEYTKSLFEKNQKSNKNTIIDKSNDINKDNNIIKNNNNGEDSEHNKNKENNNDSNNQLDNKIKNENDLNITSDDNIPDTITKDSVIYKQFLYWKYICKKAISK